jgi:hypothetical protein
MLRESVFSCRFGSFCCCYCATFELHVSDDFLSLVRVQWSLRNEVSFSQDIASSFFSRSGVCTVFGSLLQFYFPSLIWRSVLQALLSSHQEAVSLATPRSFSFLSTRSFTPACFCTVYVLPPSGNSGGEEKLLQYPRNRSLSYFR